MRRQGAQEFDFDAEIARLRQECQERSGVFRVSDFKGPVGIPEMFRAAF